jgi:RNA polymerase sigma-70 factor (ECF subfamily)
VTSPSVRDSCVPIDTLIRACTQGDPQAWEEFLQRTHAVIASTLFRSASRFHQTSPALIDDLVQETYLRLCENRCRVLRDFQADDPDAFFGLLKAVAFSVAQDHFRGVLAAKRGGGKVSSLDALPPGAATGFDPLPALERETLLKEIDDFFVAHEVLPVERQIFWLHYRQGVTAKAIAALPGIDLTAKGVESLLRRLTMRLRTLLVEKHRGTGMH